MSLLFAHNIKLKKDEYGNLYTHSSYNEEIWKRYLNISGNLSVITRPDVKTYNEKDAKKRFEKFDSSKINNIEVIDHTKSSLSFINPINRMKNNKIIKEAVKSHDLVIARIPSEYGHTAIKYAQHYNKPYLVEVVACGWDSLWNYNFKGKILAPINYLKQKTYVKNAHYAIYVTNDFLQKRYPTNGKSVNCSNVFLTEFDDNILDTRLKKIDKNNYESKIIIGTTAALNVRTKGQRYIIESLGKLKKQGITNYEYQLVGGGDKNYLEEVAEKYNVKEQIKFLGPIPHKDVFKWLETIDIYAQPSRQEGLPRALIEAMSRGLPSIGAKTAGIPELLQPEFIFSNTKYNIEEICSILTFMSPQVMAQQAMRNYNEAKNYDNRIIEERRKNFFEKFKKENL